MGSPTLGSLRRALLGAHARGEPVALAELARQLLRAAAPVPEALARRVVAAAIGAPPESLPDPLDPRALAETGGALGPDTPLALADFVVVDLETTGLARRAATILEIGAVRISRLRVVERFETLVHPGRAIPPGITALTGITDTLVRRAPPLAAAMPRFAAWLGETPGAPFVAHNAAFDQGFVAAALAACGLPPLAGPVLCTKLLSRRLVPELGRFGLDRLAAHFEIENRARHRALGDADATAEALLRLLAIARSNGIETIGQLAALQAGPRRPRRPAVAAPMPAPEPAP